MGYELRFPLALSKSSQSHGRLLVCKLAICFTSEARRDIIQIVLLAIKSTKESVMLTSRVTSKGQMTIPKTIRDYLGISAGDRLTFIIRDGEVIFYPVKGTLLDLRGSIQGNKQPEDLDAVRKVVREKIARKSAQ